MTNDAMKSSRFEIEELPYGYDALMPQISEETMRYHHDRHYATYVAKLNELSLDTPFAGQPLEDVVRSADGPLFNNAAQAWNHAFLFRSLSPAPQTAPDGALLAAVERDFGSFEALRTRMIDTAVGLFGSGWCWLSKDSSGRLRVERAPMRAIRSATGWCRCSASTSGSTPIISITATAAPMPSRPSGSASTGAPSASATGGSAVERGTAERRPGGRRCGYARPDGQCGDTRWCGGVKV